MISYELHLPAPHLRKYIQYYHVINAESLQEHQKTSCVSKISMLINYGDIFCTYFKNQIVDMYPRGISCSGFSLHSRDFGKNIKKLKVVVVDFSHQFAADILQENIQNLTNTSIDISHFKSTQLLQRLPDLLARACNDSEKINILNDLFSHYLFQAEIKKLSVFENIYDIIFKVNGKINLQQISDDLGYSERTIRRKVYEAVGVSPSEYIKTVRAEFALSHLLYKPEIAVHDLVEGFGYYDQSHFINDIKKIILLTPNEIRQIAHKKQMYSLKTILKDKYLASSVI